jgi:arabinan endo-1,5-alpha-L-arabinosidase
MKLGNYYYLLYSVSTWGSQRSEIGYATSQTLDSGSWEDHGTSGVGSDKGKPYNAIDGNIVVDGDHQYIAFGSHWAGLHITKIKASSRELKRLGPEKQVASTPASSHAVEASFIFLQGGKHYLFFSSGQCCGLDQDRPRSGEEYTIRVCRSVEGPLGPFTDKSGKKCVDGGGTVVLPSHDWVYAPGGQGVINDPEHGVVLYYHYCEYTVYL